MLRYCPCLHSWRPQRKNRTLVLLTTSILLLLCTSLNLHQVQLDRTEFDEFFLAPETSSSLFPDDAAHTADIVEVHWPKPRIVISAGPHKTRTTYVQDCLAQWSAEDMLENWVWPRPPRKDMKDLNLKPLAKHKRYATLLAVLRNSTRFLINRDEPVSKKEVINFFSKHMQTPWSQGKSIIFGAEAMSHIVDDRLDGKKIIDDILNVLPGDDKTRPIDITKDVEVVVHYRTPRVSHLVSVWHQNGHKNVSFSEFLLHEKSQKELFRSNSLGLAFQFLQRGIRTTIIDMGGMDQEDISICQALACDILRVPCDKKHNILSLGNNQEPEKQRINQKHGRGEMDLTQEQLDSLDQIMNDFDCRLRRSMFEYRSILRILYQGELFQSCQKDRPPKPFSWVIDKIGDALLS